MPRPGNVLLKMPRRSLFLLVLGVTSLLFFVIYSISSGVSSANSFRQVQDSYKATLEKHLTTLSSSFTTAEVDDDKSHTSSLNWTKVATAIETRDSVVLIPILQSFLANVPRDWPFVIWTGIENHKILSEAAVFRDDINSGRLNFTRLDLTGPDYRPNAHDTTELSELLAGSDWFWTQFHAEAEWMLFFQFDSVLCSRSDQRIDDWLGYDFVGAPSDWTHGPAESKHGGNGGLSIRKISSMLAISRKTPRKKNGPPEDVHFRDELERLNTTRWPEDEGRREALFSLSQGWMEDESINSHWKPLGVHYGLRHMGHTFELSPSGLVTNKFHRIIQHCPEILYLRYATQEFVDVDMSEFRPDAKPRPSADEDMLRLNQQYQLQTSKLTETIEGLQERLKQLESQLGTDAGTTTNVGTGADNTPDRVAMRPTGLTIDNIDSGRSDLESSDVNFILPEAKFIPSD